MVGLLDDLTPAFVDLGTGDLFLSPGDAKALQRELMTSFVRDKGWVEVGGTSFASRLPRSRRPTEAGRRAGRFERRAQCSESQGVACASG